MDECQNCGAPASPFCSPACEQVVAQSRDAPVYDPLIKAPPTDPTQCPF